jgi:enolase
MTPPGIHDVKIRAILNSGGGVAAEAELVLSDGTVGRGSAPVAIKPGRRERPVTDYLRIGSPPPMDVVKALSALSGRSRDGQEAVDAWLDGQLPVLGTDVALAVSLAYARASATASGRGLYSYFAALSGTEPAFPGLLAAVVSGGLHRRGHGVPFQQIMFATERHCPGETIPLILEAYTRAERLFEARGLLVGHSASGGMLLGSADLSLPLGLLSELLEHTGAGAGLSLAVDVAAEHLWTEDGYLLGERPLGPESLMGRIADLTTLYPITFVEDPFTSDHSVWWARLRERLPPHVAVVGDDLYATNSAYLDPALADGIVLKMNQVGTVSAALRTSVRAAAYGMSQCVSHRSLETEDTSVADLAVGVAARWLKIGGPRRGDRTAKYNRLLRLAEALRA